MASPPISPTALAKRLDDPAWVIVDCRFVLTDPDAGHSAYRRGHVPGAVNWPFSDALQPDGRMRPVDELHARLKDLTEPPGGLIAMCGSGVTACHLRLAVTAAGLGDGRVYVGSWSEWIRDPQRPIATGAAS